MANSKKNEVKITKKIEGDAWKKAQDEVFKKRQKEVKVDGFRPGKVPRNIYEKKFGKESLYLDAADKVLGDAFEAAMAESKAEPVVQPRVDVKSIDDTGVEFEFTIITKPDVKVKKYKGFGIKKETVKVTKEEIAHELGHLLERYTELVPKEGKVAKGDIAIIDFEGFKDGVAFDGGKGENYSLEIGSNTFIPGFEDQVIGMKAGDEKDINVTFPEEYPAENLKGAPVVFKVKCNDVKQKQVRELDKDFFDDLGMEGIDTKEKLEAEIKSNIKANKDMEAENKYVDAILEEVGKNTEVDIPEEMVEEEIDRLIHRFEEQIKMQGISLDVYYQFTKSTEKDLRNQMEKEAFKNVLYRLMLEELIKIEKLEVTDKEVDKEATELAKKYQMPKEEFIKQFGGTDMIKYDLEMRKVVEFLKDNNK